MDIKKEIRKITNEVIKIDSIDKIYLFGSFAYGNPTEDSDIDLCIITKENNLRKRDMIKLIRKSIAKVAETPVDILVYSKEEFLEMEKLETTLEYKIAHEGVNIYEQ